MNIRVLLRQAMELACLYHLYEANTELEVSIPNIDSRPNGHVGNSRGGVIAE